MPIKKQKDIFIALYNPRDTIYTDQTGRLPHASSRGHRYQMIVHEIDGNSTWVEPMKNKSQGEMLVGVLDVDKGPGEVAAFADGLDPGCLGGETCGAVRYWMAGSMAGSS